MTEANDLQVNAFFLRAHWGFFALQNFLEGFSTLLCKSDRGLGIMLWEILRAFQGFRWFLLRPIGPLLKVSGPEPRGVDADRTLRHIPFALRFHFPAGESGMKAHSRKEL